MAEHYLICATGLGNEEWIFHRAMKNWQKNYGLTPVVVNVYWRKKENGLAEKLKKVTDVIDELSKKGGRISLLGSSASGSLMINAFSLRKDKSIKSLITVAGYARAEALGYRLKELSPEPRHFESQSFWPKKILPNLHQPTGKKS